MEKEDRHYNEEGYLKPNIIYFHFKVSSFHRVEHQNFFADLSIYVKKKFVK